jgi:exopolysaccharide biosynthesis polyprenyl glycosylphosphotransferase
MNGTAQRPSAAAPTKGEAPPPDLLTEGMPPPQPVFRAQAKGRSLVHGLPVQIAYAATDAFFVLITGVTIFWLRFGLRYPFGAQYGLFASLFGRTNLSFILLHSALVVLCCASLGLYSTPRERGFMAETKMVVKAVGVATALLMFCIFASGSKILSRVVFTGSGAISVLTVSGWRAAKRQSVLRRKAAGHGISRVLMVGAERQRSALARWLEENRHLGYEACGYLVADPKGDARALGSFRDLRAVALAYFVDELFIALPFDRELVKEMALDARQLRLGLKIVPDLYDGLAWRAPLHTIGGFPVMDLHWQPIPTVGLALKRAMDVSVASLGLVLTAPILAIAALWIRLDSPGPAIYAAPRVGKKGRKFRCYKLRTMVANADAHKETLRGANERKGPFFKMEKDPRITRCGRWLRKFSIDELPQLVNVWLGDMCLVGPRPHPVDDYDRYTLEDLRRLDVKPGITGLWQVTARRDPSFETNMALDLDYIDNWNLWLDMKILLKTIPEVFRGTGH